MNSPTPTNTATSTITQPVTRTIAPTSTFTPTKTETATLVPTITSTSTPSSTPTIPAIPPKIYSKEEAAAVKADSIPLLTYMSFLTKSIPVAISAGWGATTKDILEENLASINWLYSIDGVSIPMNTLNRADKTYFKEGGVHPWVNFYSILNNWNPGIHHANSKLKFESTLNNGFDDVKPDDKNNLSVYTIFVFDGETKEKDFTKWATVYQENFETKGGYWSPWKMGKENDEISCETLEGEFVCSINQVFSRLITTRELGVISSDKYYLSIDTDIIDVSEGMSPCFGFSYNQDRNLVSNYPFNLAGICNIKGKAALTIEEYSANVTGKASDFILHEDWGKIKNISLLVNGRNVQFFVNEKKVQEKYIPGIMPGRTVGLYVEFLPGSTMHFNLDNFKLAMPVNLSDLQDAPTP
jgi:hypothetical protein